MFKSWQIFVFSLVPLALAFAGVIAGSYHGSDSSKEIYPTPAPVTASSASTGSSASSTPGAAGAAATGGVSLALTAHNLSWDKRTLTAPPNTQVNVVVNNQDAGVSHNFAVYTNNKATTKIFAGDLAAGPTSTTYTFKTPAAGTYFFRCDAHPDQMTGTFTVK